MEELDNDIEEYQIEDIMRKSLEYYNYIDVMGEKLSAIISEKVEPFLREGNFEEAKKMVKDFYKLSKHHYNNDREGDVIFIEYDLLMASINRRQRDYEAKLLITYDKVSQQ